MSKAKTKSVTTAEGTVEYETVECSSCGNEIAKESAKRFVLIDDLKREKKWRGHTEFDCYEYTDGWACEYCREDPVGFPKKGEIEAFVEDYKDLLNARAIEDAFFKTVMIGVVITMIILLVGIILS